MTDRRRPDADSESQPGPDVEKKSSPDVVMIHEVETDGKGLKVLRYRDEHIEAGTLRPIEHGKPIRGELLRLTPRREHPWLCDVKVELPAPPDAEKLSATESLSAKNGPAQVATDRYRENWERIWKRSGELPN